MHMSITEQALKIIKIREFIAMATASKEGKPNCAPKLLLKVSGDIVYFVDYSLGKTFENLKVNAQVSLAVIDIPTLFAYRLNGKVEIIKEGEIFDQLLRELGEKETELSVDRVIKGVQKGKAHKDFESGIPEHFLVYKVKIEEGCQISPRGLIKRESG